MHKNDGELREIAKRGFEVMRGCGDDLREVFAGRISHRLRQGCGNNMHPVIHFQSRLFDISKEPENPINPIPGSSLLEWLRTKTAGSLAMSAPSSEDWGWYSDARLADRSYLIGSCAHESPDGNHEWVLQIEKFRSLKEKLLGQAKMAPDDPCFALIRSIIMQEPEFTEISVETGP
jgi:hypothetical protein